MNARMDFVGGPGAARDAANQADVDAQAPVGLDESWFKWPKPNLAQQARAAAPAAPPRPTELDDGLADAWFR